MTTNIEKNSKISSGVKASYVNNPELREKRAQVQRKTFISIDISSKQRFTHESVSAIPGFTYSRIKEAMQNSRPYKNRLWFYSTEVPSDSDLSVILAGHTKTPGFKVCSTCAKNLPYSSFYVSSETKLGVSSKCKECECKRKRTI